MLHPEDLEDIVVENETQLFAKLDLSKLDITETESEIKFGSPEEKKIYDKLQYMLNAVYFLYKVNLSETIAHMYVYAEKNGIDDMHTFADFLKFRAMTNIKIGIEGNEEIYEIRNQEGVKNGTSKSIWK